MTGFDDLREPPAVLSVIALTLLGACPPKTFCSTTGAVAADALFEVQALAADDAWAFGQGAPLHWNGSEWSLVPFPRQERLSAALALAPNDIWATGGMDAYHWDGARWSWVDKGRKDGWAGPIVQLAPGEVWVLSDPFLRVNGTKLERLDEKRASQFAVPESMVTDAAACGPNDLWVGRAVREAPLLQHFDGKNVRRVPVEGRGQIRGVSCLDGAAWVFLESAVYRCTSACKPVPAPAGARLLRGKSGPWITSEEGLLRWDGNAFVKKADLPGGWIGGAARTDSDVWVVGPAGEVAHFDGKRATQNTSVDLGRLHELSATKQGEVWAVSESGVFVHRTEGWTRITSFPGQARWGGHVWADSPKHVWVIGNERAWHWDGARWSDVTPGRAVDVWGRDERDVYLSTGEELLKRVEKKWKVLAKAPDGWRFVRIEGDAERVAVLVQGPRPEEGDGRPTGLPDRVLLIDKRGEQKTFDLPYREHELGFVLGELWASDRHRGISRRVGESWVRLDVTASIFVATPTGAVVAGSHGTGGNWNGKAIEPFTLPLADLRLGVATGETVWLGGDRVVLRRD